MYQDETKKRDSEKCTEENIRTAQEERKNVTGEHSTVSTPYKTPVRETDQEN